MYDATYFTIKLAIPRESYGPEFTWVKIHLRDKDGLSVGMASDKPILETCMYKVEFPERHN